MNSDNLATNPLNWQQQAKQYSNQGQYAKAASLYEKAIAVDPDDKLNYWLLGLMLLLQGQEEEAQTTWWLGMAEAGLEQIDGLTEELVEVLQTEANRQAALADYSVAWAIRQHIREINPTAVNNLLHLIDLTLELKTYQGTELEEFGLLSLLQTEPSVPVNQDLLLHVLAKLLNYAPLHPSSLEFTEACQVHIQDPIVLVDILLPVVYEIAYSWKSQPIAISFCEIGLKAASNNRELLLALASFYADVDDYSKAINFAKLCLSEANDLSEQIYDSHVLLRALLKTGAAWDEVSALTQQLESLINSFATESTIVEGSATILRLYTSAFYFPYFRDCPQTNIKLRQQVNEVCQASIEAEYREEVQKYRQGLSDKIRLQSANKSLKIGYLSHCLRRHSVGWIAQWLFEYHDQDKFEIYAYLLASKSENDPLLNWYANKSKKAYQYGLSGLEVAEQVYEDEIDVLVDLDSLTLASSCGIMALKPAPIQVSWLGWDSSEIPTIDYFIADPYVLPEDAQDYYKEKIWRLPQTYVAVSGFEIGVPQARRDQLDIPNDAIVYLSAQRGPKYNPNHVRLQMQILKDVPNSYLLIKGLNPDEKSSNLYIELAEAEGLGRERLRFLPSVRLEETHRANLGIADVVLDTYPYNGATTTLETLWVGIPIVTRVGQQFAARNSYTMMMNAGITEGIAWTDEEYVEWGIRLGTDEALRQQVAWKLRQSKQTAPLWNAKQFTREMEKAYQQMWQNYLDGRG